MRLNPMITISPMQSKLFSQANRLNTPNQQPSTSSQSLSSLPRFESNMSKTSSSYFNNGLNSNLTLSNLGSQISNASNISKTSSLSKSSLKNTYIHTEYDSSLNRVKSTFLEKPIPETQEIYLGTRFQSQPNQDNYRRKFYSHNGQLNQGVIYNKYYGQNNLEIEEYEDTVAPYHYFKISTRDNQIISTTTVRPHKVAQMISSNQYLPTI